MNVVKTGVVRTTIVSLLITGLSTPVVAGDLTASLAKVVQQSSQPQSAEGERGPMPRKYLWPGAAMFVGGLATGLYLFMHNKNGEFPGTDEYGATDKKLGGVALATAFAGGAVLFLGTRASRNAAMVTVNPDGIAVSNRISW
jgi:hypothetical protein